MLTHLLGMLSINQTHWMARRLKVYAGLHEFMHGFCPCSVDYDLGEDDLDAA